MADVIYEWVGNAPPVQQIESFEITSTSLNDEFTLTINGKEVTATADGATNEEQVVDDLVALWNARPYPECADAVATKELNSSNYPYVIKLAASMPGRPFSVTMSADGSFSSFEQVANSGPNVWGVAANYQNTSTGAYELPGASDEVHFRLNRPPVLYGLTGHALAAVQLKNLRFDQAYIAQVGLTKRNSRGYNEYLPTSLYQKTAKLEVGRGSGAGSPMLKIDIGNVLCNALIYNTGRSSTTDYAALQIDNLGTTSIVTVTSGEVDFFRESSGSGGMISYKQLGGRARVFDGDGSVDMTSVSIYTHPGATLLWDSPLGGTAGDCILYGGNVTFDVNTTVGANGTMQLLGPAKVVYKGGDIDELTLSHASAVIDFRDIANAPGDPLTITTLNWNEGTIKTGDAPITVSGSLPKGTLTATYP